MLQLRLAKRGYLYMKRLFLAILATAIISSPALAESSNFNSTRVNISIGRAAPAPTGGYDVSYPQCSAKLPTAAQLGIVGVNGGLANNQNTCFTPELTWAKKSVGGTGQPAAA